MTQCSGTMLSAGVNTQNQLTETGYAYDASGDMTADGVHTYAYDAEGEITQVDGSANYCATKTGSPATACYAYSSDGQRTEKTTPSGTTSYFYSGGEVLAEYNGGTAGWSDYIYAGGARIARADNYVDQITVTGNDCSSCGYQSYQWNFSGAGGLAGYVIQSGDKVGWRQGQTASAYDGLNIVFTDGSQTAGVVSDQSGQDMASGTDGYRTADLSGEAGKTISQFQLSMNNQGSLAGGLMFVVYGDIVLYSRDGTVRPVYTEELSASLSGSGTSGITGVTATIGHINNSYNPPIVSFPQSTTVYYHGDQIGSARLMTDGQGNPIWSGVFLPFGQEWNAQATMNHYKFTGQERDAETNLDYFGARYYSSALGRFVSADWSAIPEPIPYADFTDPQSLNLYTYVRDLPTVSVDAEGHDIVYDPNLKNADDVKAVVAALLTNSNTAGQLSGYVGKDNPDLIIRSGDLNPGGPVVTQNNDGTTTTTRVDGNTDPDIQTTKVDDEPPETRLVSATITVDNGVKGIDKLAEVMAHESDHAEQARTDPAGYRKERAQNMKDYPNSRDHDKRSQEQRANKFAKDHANDIAKQAKAIKKRKKEDNQP